jgi:glycerate dehydrogenase
MKRIHVVETIRFTESQRDMLSRLGDVTWFDGVPDLAETIRRCNGADVVMADWAPIDAAIPLLTMPPGLIAVPFTGVGFLPLAKARGLGISIANAPGYATESVAEFAIGLMLAISRNIVGTAARHLTPAEARALSEMRLLVLGAGQIGSYMVRSATNLGMKVAVWRRGDNLLTALAQADIVYCALPLSADTENLLDTPQFSAMPQGSYFISTSHYKIYSVPALLAALNANIAGAALDLEGVDTGQYDHPTYKQLAACQQIVVTPHVAYRTTLARNKSYDLMISNVQAFCLGQPSNIVN